MPMEYNPNAPLPAIPTQEPQNDLLQGIQEAIASASPLLRITDPNYYSGPTEENRSKSKNKHRHSSKSHRDKEHRAPRSKDVIVFTLMEQEQQKNNLKSLLKTTGEYLERERKRADEESSRAFDAVLQVQRENFRASAAESSHKQAEEQYNRVRDELRREQMRNDGLEREARRAREEVKKIEEDHEALQEASDKLVESMCRLGATLQEYQLKEGYQERLHRQGLKKSFADGEEEGWNAGYEKGLKDGKRIGYANGLDCGRKEGVAEGVALGWMEERRNAIETFERVVASEEVRMANDMITSCSSQWQGLHLQDYYTTDAETASISSLGESH